MNEDEKKEEVFEEFLEHYLDKISNAKSEDAYKIYEKYAYRFGIDVKDQNDVGYWKVQGESDIIYGETLVFETKESLKNKNEVTNNRPTYLDNIFDERTKDEIIKKFPSKCDKCGFYRFFGIKTVHSSIDDFISIICPNCKTELVSLDD